MNTEQRDHFQATDVEWDPTGRFVCSSVSYLRHQVGGPLGVMCGSMCMCNSFCLDSV